MRRARGMFKCRWDSSSCKGLSLWQPNHSKLCDKRITIQRVQGTMPPSLRFTHPNISTPRPDASTTFLTTSLTSIQNIPVTPFDAVSQNLRFNARVPIAGMHSSNHASDSVRTGIHLSSSSFSTIEPFEKIEFDGSNLE